MRAPALNTGDTEVDSQINPQHRLISRPEVKPPSVKGVGSMICVDCGLRRVSANKGICLACLNGRVERMVGSE